MNKRYDKGIMQSFVIYGVLALYTIINIIVPISGSATITPLLVILTDPHQAIALASVFFFITAVVRVVLFQNHIRMEYVKRMLPISVLGAIIGAFALIQVSTTVVLWIIFVITTYFLLKKLFEMVKNKTERKQVHHVAVGFVGLFSGFLQGSGLAGSDLRNSYLYAEGLTIPEVHGTTAVMGSMNFFVAIIVRLMGHQVSYPELGHWLLIFIPLIILTTWIGKFALLKIPRKYADPLVLIVMGVIAGMLLWKLVG